MNTATCGKDVNLAKEVLGVTYASEKVAPCNNSFAARIYGQMASDKRTGNIILSPYSIFTCMAMVAAGACGNTLSQLLEVFRYDECAGSDGHILLHDASANPDGTKRADITCSNSAWLDRRAGILQSYIDGLVESDVEIRTESFEDLSALRTAINNWVEQKTGGKIKNIISSPLDVLTAAILVNTILFKGMWAEPFPKHRTSKQDFRTLSGGTKKVDTMLVKTKFKTVQTKLADIAEIDYNNDISMVVFVPVSRALLPSSTEFTVMEQGLAGEFIAKVMMDIDEAAKNEGWMYLPRFSSTTSTDLVDTISKLGAVDVFSPGSADLSNMASRKLYVSDVIHQATIKVDEEGTEAAAATAVICRSLSLENDVREFKADRSFIYMIRNKRTGMILFMGRVDDPSQS